MKISFWELLEKDLGRFVNIKDLNRVNKYFLIIRYFVTSNSFRSIFFYRFLNVDFIKRQKYLKFIIVAFSNLLTNVDIGLSARIGGGLFIPHPHCVIIGGGSVIGNNVTIQQNVTIGDNMFKMRNGRTSPLIEDNVLIGAGAKVIGPVKIGKNSIIGANAVVVKDIPMNSVAVGVPAKVINKVEQNYVDLLKNHL